jgi:hypothetical protein
LVIQDPELPIAAVRSLHRLAGRGLPIIIVGNPEFRSPFFGGADGDEAAYQKEISQLIGMKTVRRVTGQAAVPQALGEMGIQPRVKYSKPVELLNVLRADGNTRYVYLYNQGSSPVETEIAVAAEGQALQLDPWTGQVVPLGLYRSDSGRTIIPVKVAPGATRILAVESADGVSAPVHAVTSKADAIIARDGRLFARGGLAGSFETVFSNGRTATTEIGNVPSSINLDQWHLKVEDWRPGASATETRKNIIEVDLIGLVPWTKIPAVGPDVSGIGYYTTSFSLPPEWDASHGAYIDLGPIFETASAKVNGSQMPPVDIKNPVMDIGDALKAGNNVVEIIVTTTLNNRLMQVGLPQDRFPFQQQKRAKQEYGLIGPVKLTFYRQAEIRP